MVTNDLYTMLCMAGHGAAEIETSDFQLSIDLKRKRYYGFRQNGYRPENKESPER